MLLFLTKFALAAFLTTIAKAANTTCPTSITSTATPNHILHTSITTATSILPTSQPRFPTALVATAHHRAIMSRNRSMRLVDNLAVLNAEIHRTIMNIIVQLHLQGHHGAMSPHTEARANQRLLSLDTQAENVIVAVQMSKVAAIAAANRANDSAELARRMEAQGNAGLAWAAAVAVQGSMSQAESEEEGILEHAEEIRQVARVVIPGFGERL